MGTRAQFFIGNPEDTKEREWLGCFSWDGYPEGEAGDALKDVGSVDEFRAAVSELSKRKDWTSPTKNSFPYPWKNDLFLTDCTYIFRGREVEFTYFHNGWVSLKKYLRDEDFREIYHGQDEQLPDDVPAPFNQDKPKGPDSIIVMSA